MNLTRILGALLTLAAATAAQTQAPAPSTDQKPPEYVFSSTTRLVILDIVATDKQGNRVTDLKPEEVQILENGREQQKRDFTFVQPNPQLAASRAPVSLPPDVFTNTPQYQGNSSYNVILFDVLNSGFAGRAYAHDELIKYLDQAPPNQPTAIFALGNKLWLLHDFTTDHDALKDVIRRFKGQGSRLVTTSPDNDHAYQRKSTFTVAGAEGYWTTLDAFRALTRILSAYKGRKNLIWIAELFALNPLPVFDVRRGPQFMSPYSRQVESLADEMMQAQISVYPIDPSGLSGNAFGPMLRNFDAHSTLRDIAERTGGRAYVNQNDVARGIRESIDDGSSYYTTSYYPAKQAWDGKLRKVEVKTTRPGVTLRYRQGYYGVDSSALPQSEKDLKREARETSIDFAQALDPDLPASTALPFRARVVPPSEKTQNKVLVNFAVDPLAVRFNQKDDGFAYAEVSCIAWAFPVKGKPIGSGGGTIHAKLDAETYQRVLQSALPCSQSLQLEPGNYMLRLGVIDQSSKRIGALTAWVTVPEAVETASPSRTSSVPKEK